MNTGVWCVLADLSFVEACSTEPILVDEEKTVFVRGLMDSVPLPRLAMEIAQFRIPFQTNEPRVVSLDFHCDFAHIGTSQTYTGVIGASVRLAHRYGQTLQEFNSAGFVDTPFAVGGCNIINRDPHHYGNKSVLETILVQPGYHEFSVKGSTHTTGAAIDGLGIIHPEYNRFRVTVERVGTKLFTRN